jgi:hypothetical protein
MNIKKKLIVILNMLTIDIDFTILFFKRVNQLIFFLKYLLHIVKKYTL